MNYLFIKQRGIKVLNIFFNWISIIYKAFSKIFECIENKLLFMFFNTFANQNH